MPNTDAENKNARTIDTLKNIQHLGEKGVSGRDLADLIRTLIKRLEAESSNT